LRALRQEGRNPHIVVLQEAFTQEAQSIGRAAGYRYIADGPAADTAGAGLPVHVTPASAHDRSWAKGEDIGKYVGSGLQILSDYPFVSTHRLAYPAAACAGYDCLANKGALMAAVQLPDRSDPIDIVTTHLNSRRASRVSNDRSMRAYRLQVDSLSSFIRTWHVPSRALIVAGDFNVGKDTDRRSALMTAAESNWVPGRQRVRDVYDAASASGIHLGPDAAYSFGRAKDWAFYAQGASTALRLTKIEVPFGHGADGSMLSDHVGYTAIFRLSRHVPAATSLARSRMLPSLGERA
jgi:endonuclease/exonuclease/phosphatase family metal-dependent hydrolase